MKHVLKSGSSYVGNLNPATMQNDLTQDIALAMVCDERDNEWAKAKFFSVLFGAPFKPVRLPDVSGSALPSRCFASVGGKLIG